MDAVSYIYIARYLEELAIWYILIFWGRACTVLNGSAFACSRQSRSLRSKRVHDRRSVIHRLVRFFSAASNQKRSTDTMVWEDRLVVCKNRLSSSAVLDRFEWNRTVR